MTLLWHFLRWRVSVTVRLLRALARHPLWIVGGALVGYLALIPLALPVLVGLELAGVSYDDEDAAWVLAVLAICLVNAGGLVGYRIGERRVR